MYEHINWQDENGELSYGLRTTVSFLGKSTNKWAEFMGYKANDDRQTARVEELRYVRWPTTGEWSGPYVAVPYDDGGYDIDVRGESWIVPSQRTKPVEDDETRVD